LAVGAPPRFRKGVSADLSNLPVDHAGEFVDDRPRWRGADKAREIGAKSLAG
jgi:hypothetical protein